MVSEFRNNSARLLVVAAVSLLAACGSDADDALPGDIGDVTDAADTALPDVGSDGDAAVDAEQDATEDIHDAETGDTTPPPTGRGPGLGNLTYTEDELFRPVGWVNTDTGVPGPDPDFLVTLIKPFGTNATYMHNGYLLTVFAPDSGGGPGGLLFYDVSDPRNPRLVNRLYDPHGITGGWREAHSMGFSNFDGRQHVAFHTGAGVEIWDLDDVMNPVLLSRLDLPGVDAGDYVDVAWQLFWQGNTLYVAGSTRGLYVVDVTDPLTPVLADRGGLPNPIPTSELGGFRIGPLFAVGNVLVLSSMDDTGGFSTLDISEPWHPSLLAAQTRGLAEFYAICLGGGHIVTSVRGARARMGVWDFSDPFAIELVNHDLAVPDQLYCTTQDQFVFQGAQREVVKIDISDPAEYRIVGRGTLDVPNPDHGQVTAFGNLIYIGNDHGTGSGLMPHQLEPDTTPPQVTMVHPLDGDTLQALSTRVGLVFSDNVELHTLGTPNIVVRSVDGEALSGRFTAQGNIVNFVPEEPLLPDTTYEVVVAAGGVTDWVGNAVDTEFRSSFSTVSVQGDAIGAPQIRIERPAPSEAGEEVAFVVSHDGEGELGVLWNFGDGSGWSEPASTTANHTFEAPGHYTVSVRATNGRGWSTTQTRVTVHGPLPTHTPTASASIALAADASIAVVVNRDHGTVAAVDAASGERMWETAVGQAPTSVALGPDGAFWVAVRDAGAVVRLDGRTGEELGRIDVGRATRPVAVAADPRGIFVAVTLEATGELVTFDPTGTELGRLLLGDDVGGLSVDGDSVVRVSRFLSRDGRALYWEVTTDEVGVPVSFEPVAIAPDTTTVDAEDRGRGLPNYLGAPVLQPGMGRLWIPATSANIFRGAFRDGQALNHENTVRALALRVATADGSEPDGRIDFNDRALPTHIAVSPLGDWAWVTLQGSNMVMLLDAYTGSTAASLTGVGHGPESVAIAPDGRRVFVHSFLSRAVYVYDVGGLLDGVASDAVLVAAIPTVATEVLSVEVLAGKRIFYNAADTRMSKDGYIACASCHLDGAHDGLTWDFTDRGEGLRNTIDLRGRSGVGHGPVHWTANFDEIQDFENDIRNAFGGAGFLSAADWSAGTRSDPLGDPKAGRSAELDALAAYVSSLGAVPASPFRTADGANSEAAVRGASVFELAGCASCHGGAAFTDSGSAGGSLPRHDVGTARDASGERRGGVLDGFDTPTLLGIWATAPYLHDGSAATLDALLDGAAAGSAHDVSALAPGEVADLTRYLLELE